MPVDPEIRRASLDDVPAIRSILAAHGNDGPITTVDIVGPYVRHVVQHGRAFVSELDGEVVAYGAAVDAGVAVHLADLFVRPDLLGRGIGRPLLAAVFEGSSRRTTFASDDPRALPLYVRAGMAPLWPSLHLEGDAALLIAAGEPLDVDRADAALLAGLELAWNGTERSADHEFWASQAEADAFVVLSAGEPVAFGYARARQVSATRVLERLLVRPATDPLPATMAAIRRAARGGPVLASIQGPSPALPALLAARFRVTDRDQFMASEPGLVDPARFIPNGGML